MYKKLTIVFKNKPNSDDEFDGGTHIISYDDASITVSGDYLVISIQNTDENGNGVVEGKIHHLREILSYKGM